MIPNKHKNIHTFLSHILSKKMGQLGLILCAIITTGITIIGAAGAIQFTQNFASASGTAYHVNNQHPSASDSNSGGINDPFLTIQKCADIVEASQTCVIHAGIYREEINPVNSGTSDNPITFKNYNGDEVIITGTEEIIENQDGEGAWQNHSGNIWKIQLDSALDIGQNQIFIDDEVQIDARWPNMPNSADLMKRDDYAISESGSLVSSSGELRTGRYSHSQMPTWATGLRCLFHLDKSGGDSLVKS